MADTCRRARHTRGALSPQLSQKRPKVLHRSPQAGAYEGHNMRQLRVGAASLLGPRSWRVPCCDTPNDQKVKGNQYDCPHRVVR